jgi:hypothetical protein
MRVAVVSIVLSSACSLVVDLDGLDDGVATLDPADATRR